MKRKKPSASALTTTAPVTAASESRLLRRAEAARMLGMSVSTLRRREGTELVPRVGPDGVHLFDETEVRAISVKYRSASQGGASADVVDGGLAADVFGLLDDGVHAVEVVKRLRVHPDTIEALHAQWARMRASVVLSPELLGEIANEDGYCGPSYIKDASTLVTTFKNSTARAHAFCMVCKEQAASLCGGCAARRHASSAAAAAAADAGEERPVSRPLPSRRGGRRVT